MRYEELDGVAQIAEVQKLVPGILAEYGIEAKASENVNHSFNSSFKITDSKGEEYALRVNLASGKSNKNGNHLH